MKKLASVADQLAFNAAIEQAQATLAGSERPLEGPREAAAGPEQGKGLQRPQKAPQRRAEGRKELPEGVASLAARRAHQRAAEAEQLVELARRAGITGETLEAIAQAAGAMKAGSNDWMFAMISTDQNAAVVDWLLENSKRPQVAVKLWAQLFRVIRTDTGEVLLSRSELAERVGTEPRTLSSIMTELASINAVQRQQDGRRVRYFMNPHIATHIPSPAARKAARDNVGPLLVVMQGSRTEEGSESTS